MNTASDMLIRANNIEIDRAIAANREVRCTINEAINAAAAAGRDRAELINALAAAEEVTERLNNFLTTMAGEEEE